MYKALKNYFLTQHYMSYDWEHHDYYGKQCMFLI